MKSILGVLLMLLISGCGTPSPYATIGIAYNIDEQSDWFLRSERDWTCSNKENFHAEVGLEWDNKTTLGYHHQSHVTCGGPFNDRPELYQDEIILTKKWGGK